MISKSDIDHGRTVDWGRTSTDYARHRPGYPASFYAKLHALGIGTEGQTILDLGTGTGVLARAFARQGADVKGIDLSADQIAAARALAHKEHLTVRFEACAAETADFPDHTFDVISCGQSWLYFDQATMLPRIRRWLKPGGWFVLTHLCWLPRQDAIAHASEQLVLRYNPHWTAADFPGNTRITHDWALQDGHFHLVTYHAYEADLPFTRESWRGRIRASRGIGTALLTDTVSQFDCDHDALLAQLAGDTFGIRHQIWLHVYAPTVVDNR